MFVDNGIFQCFKKHITNFQTVFSGIFDTIRIIFCQTTNQSKNTTLDCKKQEVHYPIKRLERQHDRFIMQRLKNYFVYQFLVLITVQLSTVHSLSSIDRLNHSNFSTPMFQSQHQLCPFLWLMCASNECIASKSILNAKNCIYFFSEIQLDFLLFYFITYNYYICRIRYDFSGI